ncbi:glycosyltransferase family protein [Amphritea pacifica]|uniref:Glycosyltransferase n=1 Tax=Amphritea pacifica TaxID=2811233 RepID=A0ABS2W578_9GAMM|nr:hypothetical protein [Amphritea pacifica]MBN0986869.1 hypothetical protein [Amphritea pacifica]
MDVITVNYQNRSGLMLTAESIVRFKKSASNVTAVLVDGASNDLSIDDFENLKKIYDVVISESDDGIYDAMNKGLKYIKSSHVIMLNSGDVLADNFFDNLCMISSDLEQNTLYVFDWIKNGVVFSPRNISFCMLGYYPFNHQSMIIPSFYDYNSGYKISGDLDQLARMIVDDVKIIYYDFPMAVYEGGGISDKRSLCKLIEKNSIVLKNFGFFCLIKALFYQAVIFICQVSKKLKS